MNLKEKLKKQKFRPILFAIIRIINKNQRKHLTKSIERKCINTTAAVNMRQTFLSMLDKDKSISYQFLDL